MENDFKNMILEENIRKSRGGDGALMNVSMKKMRFPVLDGIQTKVTLKSNVTGTFMNIGFMRDVENTLNGNIADELLNRYPDIFNVIKVAGKLVSHGTKELERDIMKKELIRELKEEFEIKPKKVASKRKRLAETQISKGEVPSDVKDDNIFVKNNRGEKKMSEEQVETKVEEKEEKVEEVKVEEVPEKETPKEPTPEEEESVSEEPKE